MISVIFDDKFLLDINNAIMVEKAKAFLEKKNDRINFRVCLWRKVVS